MIAEGKPISFVAVRIPPRGILTRARASLGKQDCLLKGSSRSVWSLVWLSNTLKYDNLFINGNAEPVQTRERRRSFAVGANEPPLPEEDNPACHHASATKRRRICLKRRFMDGSDAPFGGHSALKRASAGWFAFGFARSFT